MEGVTPERAESYTFRVPEERLVAQEANEVIMELVTKLYAEDARVRRLLPDPPPGKLWVGTVQNTSDEGFASNETRFRIRYRLEEGY